MRIQELHENKWREFADKLKRLVAGDKKHLLEVMLKIIVFLCEDFQVPEAKM